MASSSTASRNSLTIREATSNYNPYPPPLVKYEDVVACSKLFMETLEKLHASMGTKFMIPVIGGKDLDLHRLFVEVTSRGGIQKIVRERRWKEVTNVFSFPSTATNASFVLRKYYLSLLHHYEQLYFFKAKGWTPLFADALQSPPVAPVLAHGLAQPVLQSPESQAVGMQQHKINTAEFLHEGSQVIGVIDGKFDSGYLVTVTIGSEKFKGVLYQAPHNPASQVSQHQSALAKTIENTITGSTMLRRKRRKKSEMKKRDPAHPKPNRSGYNFFFAEQHARLKPLHQGKDREISRMIGELWTKMNDSEKVVYQDKAVKDKERYRMEMEDYRERLRAGSLVSCAVPIQQRPSESCISGMETDEKTVTVGGQSPQAPENEISSGKSDMDDDRTTDKDLEMSSGVETGAEHMHMETPAHEVAFELWRSADKAANKNAEIFGDVLLDSNEEEAAATGKGKGTVGSIERESIGSEVREVMTGEAVVSMATEEQ